MKLRYCPACEYNQVHRQITIEGLVVFQCTFCYPDKPKPDERDLTAQAKVIWSKASYN